MKLAGSGRRQVEPAGFVETPEGIVGHFPEMIVRIAEIARIAAPEDLGGRFDRPCADRDRPVIEGIDVIGGREIHRESGRARTRRQVAFPAIGDHFGPIPKRQHDPLASHEGDGGPVSLGHLPAKPFVKGDRPRDIGNAESEKRDAGGIHSAASLRTSFSSGDVCEL